MFCTKCGVKNEDVVKFCVSCGEKINTDTATDDKGTINETTQNNTKSTPIKARKSVWKLILKILFIIILIPIVISVLVLSYQWYQDLPRKTDQLGTISIGMKTVDVTLKLGKPDDETTNDAGTLGYTYKDYSGINYFIAFDENKSVRRICTQNSYSEIMGLGVYDSKDTIIRKLGQPSSVSISSDGTRELISFSQYQVAFEIEKGSVKLACVSTTEMKYVDEY